MPEATAQRIWQATLGQLELQVTRSNYETWLKDTVGLSLADSRMVVGTSSDYAIQWLSHKLLPLISKTVSDLAGRPTVVSFQLLRASQRDGNGATPLFTNGSHSAFAPAPADSLPLKAKLNPRFTFERFIVAENSRMAYSAAIAAADESGEGYNPLFIYSPVGLGKTHLLHAIGHRVQAQNQRFIYLSAEHFLNEFVASISRNHSESFRQKYRSLSVLLIDDIQVLSGKEATQEEFFYTFNDLIEAGARIVITADEPPKKLASLSRRLRSRFQGGLVIDIQPPDRETKLAILQAKASEQGIPVAPPVYELLADMPLENVRDLEGVLNRTLAYARLAHSSCITPDVARNALSPFAPATQPTSLSPTQIINTVAQFFNLSTDQLTGRSRLKAIADARHIAIYLLRQDSQLSLKDIGKLVGNRDHSTIIHGHRKIATFLPQEKDLRQQVAQLRLLLSTAV